MGVLTETLERIMDWLKEHQPEYAASFLPGVKSDEIQAVEKELGFKLPEEIYELYQWRNGTQEDAKTLSFPTMQFLPLSRAIEYSQGWNEYILEEQIVVEGKWYEISPLFIFIKNSCDFCGISLVDHQREKLPVCFLGEGQMPSIFYTSFTDMMLTLAECYETEAYYLNKKGYVCEDECKAAQILYKYNAEINEKALLTFQSLLLQPLESSNNKLIEQAAEVTIVISRFKDPRGVDLLLESLQILSRAKGLCREGICYWVIKALGEMCDLRALQTLINALQDNSPFIKGEAQKALSKLSSRVR